MALGITFAWNDDFYGGWQPGEKAWSWGYNSRLGTVTTGNSAISGTYATYTVGDIIGLAIDLDNDKIYFSKFIICLSNLTLYLSCVNSKCRIIKENAEI